MSGRLRRKLVLGGLALLTAASLIVSAAVLRRTDYPPAGRLAIALVPAPMLAALMWQMLACVRRLDELQRRMLFEAIAFGVASGWVLMFLYNLIYNADIGLPKLDADWALFVFMMLAWGGSWLSNRRYHR